jgi:hypothetical protein
MSLITNHNHKDISGAKLTKGDFVLFVRNNNMVLGQIHKLHKATVEVIDCGVGLKRKSPTYMAKHSQTGIESRYETFKIQKKSRSHKISYRRVPKHVIKLSSIQSFYIIITQLSTRLLQALQLGF